MAQRSNRAAYERRHPTAYAEPSRRQPERRQPARPEPSRRPPSRKAARRRRRSCLPVLLALLLIMAGAGGYFWYFGLPFGEDTAMTFFGGRDQAVVNGETVSLSAPLLLREGELMLPAADAARFDCEVEAGDSAATIRHGRHQAVYAAGQLQSQHDEETSPLTVAPFTLDGVLYIPLADLLTACGYGTDYSAADFRLDGFTPKRRESAPVCAFATDKQTYAPGEIVRFTEECGDDVAEYEWSNRQERYFTAGEVIVSLRVKNNRGVWSEPCTRTFTVAGNEYCGASRVPVLMYHHLVAPDSEAAAKKDNDAVISSSQFAEQMKYLADNGYTTLFVSELLSYLDYGQLPPEKSVVLAFDDGYESNYLLALPILQQYGLKANVAPVVWSTVRKTDEGTDTTPWLPRLNFDQLREMIDSGCFEVGSHTFNAHASLTKGVFPFTDNIQVDGVTETDAEHHDRILNDLLRSKWVLKERLNVDDPFFVYPLGKHDQRTEALVEEAGFPCAITVKGHYVTAESYLYALERTNVGPKTTLSGFAALL